MTDGYPLEFKAIDHSKRVSLQELLKYIDVF
jgi:hypothetical protein